MEFTRLLNLPNLLAHKSFFLFGARSTGKSSLIRKQLGHECTLIDLLEADTFIRLSQEPSYLEKMIAAEGKSLVVIDEVQKLPLLLDEVHRLIEKKVGRFLLTGSSARRLKREHANMLGGRAWEARLFPLVSQEFEQLELDRFLLIGGLPHVQTSERPVEELRAYVSLYLREEVMAEGLVRDLPRFSRLLKVAAMCNAQQVNFTKLALDLGCAPSTVIEHFRILEDTLIAFFIEPWHFSKRRKEVSKAKFYIFDTGVANALAGSRTLERNSDLYGRALEQFVAMELRAYLSYRRLDHEICFWATHDGTEVDFVIPELLAIEVKATNRATDRDLRGLRILAKESGIKQLRLVSLDPIAAKHGDILAQPLEHFLRDLWSGALFQE
jgi:predicted AAA+ superfamily ATPase